MLHTCLKKFEEVIVKRKKKREFDIGVLFVSSMYLVKYLGIPR